MKKTRERSAAHRLSGSTAFAGKSGRAALFHLATVLFLFCACAAAYADTPEAAADFSLPRLGGGKVSLSDYRGQWVVLNYWATWCSPCRKEMPELAKLLDGRADVSVLGLTPADSLSDSIETWLRLAGIDYPILLMDPGEPPQPFGAPRVMPTTILVDPSGRPAHTFPGPVTREQIEQFIDGTAPDEAQTLPRGNCAAPGPRTDLRHCSFRGYEADAIDLHGALLDGVDLTNARLRGCDLSGARLVKADLKWADLGECTLTGADLSDADLFHATFDDGVLDGADFSGANMFGANLNGVRAVDTNFSRAYMKDIAMEESDFSGAAFRDCFMQRGVLIGSTLTGADLTEAVLSGAALEGADLSRAILSGALVNGARLDGAVFDRAELGGARFVNSVVAGASFIGATGVPPHLGKLLASESTENRAANRTGAD